MQIFCIIWPFDPVSLLVCFNILQGSIMVPDLRGKLRVPLLWALSSPLRNTSMILLREATCEGVRHPPPSLVSWRCLQWERPNALLEEREQFIKDWRDRALSVFYWRLPAFLWACLLQQHRYVRPESRGPLSCIQIGNSQRAPDSWSFIVNWESLRYLYCMISTLTLHLLLMSHSGLSTKGLERRKKKENRPRFLQLFCLKQPTLVVSVGK